MPRASPAPLIMIARKKIKKPGFKPAIPTGTNAAIFSNCLKARAKIKTVLIKFSALRIETSQYLENKTEPAVMEKSRKKSKKSSV
jgi:hypothetical protein